MKNNFFAPNLIVDLSKEVTKKRELPLEGALSVRIGDIVLPDTIVATASLPGELTILRISEKMGISPKEVIEGLHVKKGDQVHIDDVLCVHKGLFGLFSSKYQSQVEGTVELITDQTGHVGVREKETALSLQSYIHGKVVALEENRSVTIQDTSVYIQGIFGIGGEQYGTLYMLPSVETSPTEALLPEDCHGLVLVGGPQPDAAVLQTAQARGARGFVTASLDDRALRGYLGYDLGIALTGDEEVTMTVIMTEGFGLLPFSQVALKILQQFDRKPVSINGATQVRAGAVRPEIIISHEAAKLSRDEREWITRNALDKKSCDFEVGAAVRLLRDPFFGKRGTVLSIPKQPVRIETGAVVRVVEVKVGEECCFVPKGNLEIL
jgi:transcription antitermination factor NusG